MAQEHKRKKVRYQNEQHNLNRKDLLLSNGKMLCDVGNGKQIDIIKYKEPVFGHLNEKLLSNSLKNGRDEHEAVSFYLPAGVQISDKETDVNLPVVPINTRTLNRDPSRGQLQATVQNHAQLARIEVGDFRKRFGNNLEDVMVEISKIKTVADLKALNFLQTPKSQLN